MSSKNINVISNDQKGGIIVGTMETSKQSGKNKKIFEFAAWATVLALVLGILTYLGFKFWS